MSYRLSILILFIFCFISKAYAEKFALSSNAFLGNNVIPVLYTCDGKGISPQLTWSPISANAQSLVITLSNKTDDGKIFYYWILYNLPPTLKELPEGIMVLPAGVKTLLNSWKKNEYVAICPERGGIGSFTYTAYVLDKKLDLSPNASIDELFEAIKGHVLDTDSLVAIYSRWPVKL